MWCKFTSADVEKEFLQPENDLIAANGGTNTLPSIVAGVIAQIIGAIRSGGYALKTDDSIPDQLKEDFVALVRWRLFSTLPKTDLQSDARKDQYDNAVKRLERIARGEESIEPPTAGANPRSGNWQAENKLLMRTHPLPTPSQQFQSTDSTQPPYANPTGPQDT